MEKSKVYFADFRTKANGDSLITKLKRLIKQAGIADLEMDGKFVAIKMHFGELGNLAFLRPNYARAVVDVVKERADAPTLLTATRCILEAERMRWSIYTVHGRTDSHHSPWDVPYSLATDSKVPTRWRYR